MVYYTAEETCILYVPNQPPNTPLAWHLALSSAGSEFSTGPGPEIPIHPLFRMLIWLQEKSFSDYTE